MLELLDLALDALIDTAKLLPFLYLTYLVMEYLEHRLEGKSSALLARAGRFGPAIGGALGVVPQCGFSAAASSLYAGRVLSLGTLLAVFLSTSDEMLPIMISRQTPIGTILKILSLKLLLGICAGFLVDAIFRRRKGVQGSGISEICTDENCDCEHSNLFVAALRHTVNIALFILLFSFLINLVLHFLGEDTLAAFLRSSPVLGVFLSALVGLIPNCASSVIITTLYLDELLSFGTMMAGLLVNAGIGLLVLFRNNKNLRENLKIAALLYAIGVLCGGAIDLLHIVI